MNRRGFLRGAGAASIALTAGCSSIADQSGSPEMEWEYQWEGFVGRGFQPAVVVTGRIENVGSAYAEEFRLDCHLLAEDESVVDSRGRNLRHFEENEEQLFYYKFRPDEKEAKQIDDVDLEGSFPDQ